METVYINQKNLRDWQERAIPTVMALGYFDGLHNGHRQVIKTAASIADKHGLPLAVMSFTPHPKTVVSNGKEQVQHLMPIDEKIEKLNMLGVDTFYLIKFDKQFAKLSPEEFVAQYLVDLKVVHAIAGFDFSYGFRGSGNLDRLKADSNGIINVTKVDKIEYRGEKISSTCIRKRILAGEFNELPQFLGHLYEMKCDLNGTVLKPHLHYAIPQQGSYEVGIKNGADELKCQLVVTKDGSLKPLHSLPIVKMKSPISIVWKKRMAINEKELITQANVY
ncbi:FAD synthetase family protein [Alkalihalobacillus sp. BA299]|uniref:FAD synthetase family protein n=1 Tax=Alkalihalobacillus sp. BA299 TaxID=2815938 RepID=UPI001AD98CB4|nr:FAD synthetase family protein [Alkalihalobacillus sp. BA299]